ncbi:type II toxin-antitoxin system MqsA family antitoxin [Brevibacillus porteri]|uniref:type II toxin-antitoxin system MqsA family antitoxin n=1 Tax=Brevibacillus porteri TaxID=2126350 RepID=UPI003638B8BA
MSTCPICNTGTLEPIYKSFSYQRGSTTHIIPNVRHLVCNHCEQDFVDEEGSKLIDQYVANEPESTQDQNENVG